MIRTEINAKQAAALAKKNPLQLQQLLANMHHADVATLLLDCSNDKKRVRLLRYVADNQRGVVLLALPEGMLDDLLEMLQPSEIEQVVDHLYSDDVADIIQALDAEKAKRVLARLEPEERRELQPLLEYAEETAGGLMQTELFKVRHDWSVARLLTVLRRWGRDIEHVSYVYVVDDADCLCGVIPVYELLFALPEELAMDVADAQFPRVITHQDQEEVARFFDKRDVMAMPVVNADNVLVGRITADDILDVVQEEATEDMYRLAALSDDDDLSEPVVITAWRRGVWLMVNLFTAIIASIVISRFEATLSQIVALAILMPIVASMGGIAGTQTLTVIVRGIALGRVQFSSASRTLLKEFMVSLLTGTTFAMCIGFIASLWFSDLGMMLGVVIAIAMFVNILAAGLAGALIPLTLRRIGIDPALASGTLLTTITDVVGFASFLGLASIFLL
ncbi:MAG: magnesium transporter [Mariprofundales bacterium]